MGPGELNGEDDIVGAAGELEASGSTCNCDSSENLNEQEKSRGGESIKYHRRNYQTFRA
jgi:hypothetical protein